MNNLQTIETNRSSVLREKTFLTKANKWCILFVAMVVIFATINVIWIKRNKTAPAGNGLTDLFPAINFYLDVVQQKTPLHVFFSSPESYVNFRYFLQALGSYIRYSFLVYPPLAPLSYSLTYFIFGLNSHLELIINILYLIIALWAIYGIGRIIFDERVGFLAAFVFSTFPGVIVKTRQISSEFMLACLMPLVFLFLLQTDFFRNRKYSVLFGISLGVMALAKWEFPLTFFVPFMLYLFYSFFSLRKSAIQLSGMVTPFAHLLLSIFIATIVALPWYGVGFQDAYWRIFCYNEDKVLLSNNVSLSRDWLIQKISFYLFALANGGIHFFYFVLFILSVLFVILSLFDKKPFLSIRRRFFYLFFLCLWIFVTYLLLSFMAVQNLSHALAILPAVAIVISLGVLSRKNHYLRRFLIGSILIYGVCAYARSFVIIKPFDFINSIRLKMTPRRNLGLELVNLNHPLVFAWEGKRLYEPDERDWKEKEIIAFIQQDSRILGRKPLVYFLGLTIEEFTVFTLQYYNLLSGFTLFFEPRGNDKSQYPPDRSRFDYVAILSDKIISQQTLDERLTTSYNVDPKNQKTDLFRKEFFHKFSFIRNFFLPNGAKLYIYKRNPD
jgi:hypothetical protein